MQPINRRRFLQTAGSVAALSGSSAAAVRAVSLVVDPSDSVANSAPAKWAAQELERSLKAAGGTVQMCRDLSEAKQGNQCIVAAASRSAAAQDLLKRAGVSIPDSPEALGLVPGSRALLAVGHDTRWSCVRPPRLGRSRAKWSASPSSKTLDREATQSHSQLDPSLHERRGRQALVQRPRDVAAVSDDARDAALQSFQPGAWHRLRLPPASHRRVLSVRLSVPAGGARLQRARSPASGCRARRESGNAAVHHRADRRPRHGVPTRPLDARLRVDRQPQAELHDRRTHRGEPRALLPRCRARRF